MRQALKVALAVLAIHAAWIVVYLAAGQEARDFARLGEGYVRWGQFELEARGERPPVAHDPTYDYPENRDAPEGTGYDGQFSYYIAVSPQNGRYYADYAGYRYSRILYPIAARVLAAGDADVIPFTLILVNLLAIGAGTLAVAGWLVRRSCSPWWAAVYGLYPGLLSGLQRDLTEPLAYGLVAGAIYMLDRGGGRWRPLLWAGVLFGLAGLTRQSTMVFAALFVLSVVLAGEGFGWRDRLRANARPALLLAALSFLPLLAWTVVVTRLIGPIETDYLEPLPLLGLVRSTPWELVRQGPVLVGVVLPALAMGAIGLRGLLRDPLRPEIQCLLANILLFVVFLGAIVYSGGYTGVGRNATGIVLAGVLAIPALRPVMPASTALRVGIPGLTLAMFPVLLVYDFTYVG